MTTYQWTVFFLQDHPPGPLGPGPDLECMWVSDRSKRRFLGVERFEVGRDYTAFWRDLVMANGPGAYDVLDYADEELKKPARLRYHSISFIEEHDIEGWRLYPLGAELTDERIAMLEAELEGAAARGDAAPADELAAEYERRESWQDVKRVALIGMEADDHDPGIWVDYLEEKRPLRNIQRRLLSRHNRASKHLVKPGYDGTLYSTVDVGEADPERECTKCGRRGALPAEYSFLSIRLCHACRRLPRSEWPERKPLPPSSSAFLKAPG